LLLRCVLSPRRFGSRSGDRFPLLRRQRNCRHIVIARQNFHDARYVILRSWIESANRFERLLKKITHESKIAIRREKSRRSISMLKSPSTEALGELLRRDITAFREVASQTGIKPQ
jgi:hypothetical protein